ncbi:hypothetical protein Tco_0571824 [Tanacetum coccineum]
MDNDSLWSQSIRLFRANSAAPRIKSFWNSTREWERPGIFRKTSADIQLLQGKLITSRAGLLVLGDLRIPNCFLMEYSMRLYQASLPSVFVVCDDCCRDCWCCGSYVCCGSCMLKSSSALNVLCCHSIACTGHAVVLDPIMPLGYFDSYPLKLRLRGSKQFSSMLQGKVPR